MSSSPPLGKLVSGLPFYERPSPSVRGPLAGGRQITRNRASYSCHTCRRRKVKCDKVHPVCGNCAKTGAECIYDPSSQKRENAPDRSPTSTQGVKRRRDTARTLEEGVDELQSIYGHLKEAGSSPGGSSDSRAIAARLDKLMSMIERLGDTAQALEAAQEQAAGSNHAEETTRIMELRRKDASVKRITSSRPSSPRRAATESGGDEFPIPSGQATDLVDPVGSLNLGHLSLEDGGRSRYVGTTYWAYISHEINDLNQLLRDQNRSRDFSSSDATEDSKGVNSNTPRIWEGSVNSPADSTIFRPRGTSLQQSIILPSGDSPSVNEKIVEPEMLKHVPSRRQSHILYKGFMSGIHAISPVIHPPTVLKLYNAFWDWYDSSSYSGESCPNPSFIPLLYAIWYGGSVTISIRAIKAEFDSPSRSALSSEFSEEVTRWLTKIAFPRSPSLHGLAAYLIVQTILSKEEEPLTSSLFVSLAMRVAQTMGLHRDPAKFGIEPCEAEYRRRLWWHIMHMDGVVAMSSGLPPLIGDENYWDVEEISELKDTLLGTPRAEQYVKRLATDQQLPDNPDDPFICGGPSMVNVFYLTGRGKYIMARAVRRILKIQLGTKPVTRSDMEELQSILLDLQLKLNSIVNRIPEGESAEARLMSSGRALSTSKSPVETQSTETELPGEGPNGCSEQYHTPVLVSFHKWARIILTLYIDKAFCVAYQPFLKNARSRVWPAARQSALRRCHGFMEKFIQLATDPDFQPFHWSWPGNHQPMHATMIMLIDLYERPYSPEAPKSRAFIDRILALSGPDGGVVGGEDGVSSQRPLKDGGREAWDMIRRLRQKAWQKAGLDPGILWTEEGQIQAGVATSAEEARSFHGPVYGSSPASGLPVVAQSPPQHPDTIGRQPTRFNGEFYKSTQSLGLPNPATSEQPTSTPLRYSYHPSNDISHSLHTPASTESPADITASGSASHPVPSDITSSSETTSLITPTLMNFSAPLHSHPQQLSVSNNTTASPLMPSMDLVAPNVPPKGAPTPPSMVDPNLNFDWDQWDAVFGQHLPVADEIMELDSVAGLEFANWGVPAASGASEFGTGTAPSPTNTGFPRAWANNGAKALGFLPASGTDIIDNEIPHVDG